MAPHLVQDVIEGQVSLDHAYALVQENRPRDSEAFDAADRPGRSDPPEPTVAPQPSLVVGTKRNSRRTGPKRLTPAEVAQRDQHAMADHRRRYGQPLPRNELPMPPPPAWFTKDQREGPDVGGSAARPAAGWRRA